MKDLATIAARIARRPAFHGDDMARPTLHVGYMTIIGAREIAAYEAKQAALAVQKDATA